MFTFCRKSRKIFLSEKKKTENIDVGISIFCTAVKQLLFRLQAEPVQNIFLPKNKQK